jgi:RecT family
MNAPIASQELNVIEDSRTSSLALITNDGNMQRLMSLAKIMASSKVTVPKHLQGSEGDCMAIIIQATNWGMNPFAVAQKTHLVNGTLGYEAQLVNAVIGASGAIRGAFEYEYKGDGAMMECRVGAVLRGRASITWGEWLCIGLVTTRNSPLWKTNPKQQIGYLQVKNWARSYAPGAILGVYTDDEIDISEAPRDITPRAEPEQPAKPSLPEINADELYTLCADKLNQDTGEIEKMGFKSMVQSSKKTAGDFIAWLSKKHTLSDEIKGIINGWTPIEGSAQ